MSRYSPNSGYAADVAKRTGDTATQMRVAKMGVGETRDTSLPPYETRDQIERRKDIEAVTKRGEYYRKHGRGRHRGRR